MGITCTMRSRANGRAVERGETWAHSTHLRSCCRLGMCRFRLTLSLSRAAPHPKSSFSFCGNSERVLSLLVV